MLRNLFPPVASRTSQVKICNVDVEIHFPVEPALKLPYALRSWLQSRAHGAVYRDFHAVHHWRISLAWPTLNKEDSAGVIPAKRPDVLKLTFYFIILPLFTIDGAVALIVIGDVESFVEVIRLYFSVGIGTVSWKSLVPTHFVSEQLGCLDSGTLDTAWTYGSANLWVHWEAKDPLNVSAPSQLFIERNQVIVIPATSPPVEFEKFFSFRSLLEKEFQVTIFG